MSSLTGIFKAEPEDLQENDKLVDLFRNRAELKKEFASLREEKFQLQDRLKQQQGATERVQQKMDHLESLLLDREWVHNVVAFYQLRRLAAHCHAKLDRFAEQLKQQREQRLNSQHLADWRADLDVREEAIKKEIGSFRLDSQRLEDGLARKQDDLDNMNGVSKMFSGKGLQEEIDEMEAEIEQRRTREQQMLHTLDELSESEKPETLGLDVATKRSINFMILSFAQQLYLHFEDDNLVGLAKEASEKSVGAVNYGTKNECDEIIERIEGRWDTMKSPTEFADVMQKRAKFIADKAQFRNDDDVIPAPGTAGIVYAIDANGVVKEKDANLIGDNYFGISKVLSR